jgi:transcriptional regulator with XRE-family HTH domain
MGMSQRDIAARLERTQAFVWKVEQGIQHLDIATLIDWAALLKEGAPQIVGDVEVAISRTEETPDQ